MRLIPLVLGLVVGGAAAAQGQLEWVVVGAPGNPPDDQVMLCCEDKIGLSEPTSGYGSVAYSYRITKTEIPTWAYVEFLNAVAAIDDPHGVYNPFASSPKGTIVRAGSTGAWTYAAKAGRENEAVTHMDWFRAARFANWMHNGQPAGAQDASTTEDGAYTLLGANPVGVPRNPGARFWITSEDEWYKAAYHMPGGGYVDFATGSDAPPVGEPPPGGANSANYCPPEAAVLGQGCPSGAMGPGVATDVGAYVASFSGWGIHDAVGNLIEILEEQYCCSPTNGWWMTPARGGPFPKEIVDNAAYGRNFAAVEIDGCAGCTFRLGRPAPRRCGLGWEVAPALALIAALAWRRRRSGGAPRSAA